MGIFNLFRKKSAYTISKEGTLCLVSMVEPKGKVKLGSKITVPENFCAVTLSKEKLLDTIPAGEWELSGFTIPKACKQNKMDKPTKKGYKNELPLDFYFVNLNVFKVSNSFYIKENRYSFVSTMQCDDPIKFLKFLFCERIIFDNNFATDELSFYISQLIYYYVLDNKVLLVDKLKENTIKKLGDIGILVKEIEIGKDIQETEEKAKEIVRNTIEECQEERNEKNFENEIKQEQKRTCLVDLDDIKTESVGYFVCEECGTKLPISAEKCFVCGKSFKEINTCENCGREIDENVFVCPYCKAVVLQNERE